MKTLTLTFAFVLAFAGCATDSGDPAKDARGRATNQALLEAGKVLGQVAVSTLLNVANQEMTGGKTDMGHAATQGLFANMTTLFTGNQVANVIKAYSAGRLPQTGAVAGQVFNGSKAPDAKTVEAIAVVVSTAAGAPIVR